jgi:hypothetical protein
MRSRNCWCASSGVNGAAFPAVPLGLPVVDDWNCNPNKEGKKPKPAENCTPGPAKPPAPPSSPYCGTFVRVPVGRAGGAASLDDEEEAVVALRGSTRSFPRPYTGTTVCTDTPLLHIGHWLCPFWLPFIHCSNDGQRKGRGCV